MVVRVYINKKPKTDAFGMCRIPPSPLSSLRGKIMTVHASANLLERLQAPVLFSEEEEEEPKAFRRL